MKIKIAHLYYDLMNLYGENGNVRFLKRQLEEQDITTEVHFLSIEDDIKFDKYDVFYIGTGSESNQRLVLNHLMKYKKEIQAAIADEKFFIVTGNALELFGKNITYANGECVDALNVHDFEVKEEDFRIVGEQLYKTNLVEGHIIGFQNRCASITNFDNSIFNVISGTGFNPNVDVEGIKTKHFFGTYLLGPILVRNPHLCDCIVNEICSSKGIKFKKNTNSTAYKAYDEYIKNFYKDLN